MIKALAEQGAILIAFAGILMLAAAMLRGRKWIAQVPFILDLWTAASLLSLVGEVTWFRLFTTASIVLAQNLMIAAREVPQ